MNREEPTRYVRWYLYHNINILKVWVYIQSLI